MDGSELKEQINQDRTITERIGVFKKRKELKFLKPLRVTEAQRANYTHLLNNN